MHKKIKDFLDSEKIIKVLRLLLIVIIVAAIFSLVAINFIDFQIVLALDLMIIALTAFVSFPIVGLYLMAFFYPFVSWQFVFGEFNVPYVDLVAVALLLSLIIKMFVRMINESKEFPQKILKSFPGLIFAVLFFVACALSIINSDVFGTAFKYLFRPIIFFYLMFVVLPFNLIKNKQILKNVLHVMLVVGILVSILGLLSVFFPQEAALNVPRAMPFSIAGFNPLGGNQNAVAEVLVISIPIAMILFLISEKIKKRGLYILAIALMMIVLLLTFSRAGWLALMVELLLLFFIKYRHKINRNVIIALVLMLIFIPLIMYFSVWSQLDWMESSNANRLLLTNISWYSFLEHPIIGNGLDSFQRIVGQTFVYRVEFGDPLDSHGFIQKIATESGFLGVLTFVLLLCYVFYKNIFAYSHAKFLSHKLVALCFLMLASGIVVFELFSTAYFLATTWLPLGISLAAAKLYAK